MERVPEEDKDLILALYEERQKGIERRKEIKKLIKEHRQAVQALKAEDRKLAAENREISPARVAEKFGLHKVTIYRMVEDRGFYKKAPTEVEA